MHTGAAYSAASLRALERHAIEVCGIPAADLMRRAGSAAFAELRSHWPLAKQVAIICGTGNNGGDGFVVATLAHEAGLAVELIIVGEQERVSGDARACLQEALAAGVHQTRFSGAQLRADVVVDALFGIGLNRQIDGDAALAIERMNSSGMPRMALDIPSGLDATSGQILGCAVVADVTVTFIAMKQGLLTGAGPAVCGEVVTATLALPERCFSAVAPTVLSVGYQGISYNLVRRRRDAHKGDFGHVLVVGGAPGAGGAARMAAEAAARSGAGLVTLATHPAHAATLTASRPEIMCHGVADGAALRRLCKRASVIAVGPGLGQDGWARELMAVVRESHLPQVIDADALNLLATDPQPSARHVLTPHPGEAARLLGVTTAAVQADRFAAVQALTARLGGVVVLKGAGSLVHAAGSLPTVIAGGNPGMASGGMGDVLTGIIAAFIAQHLPLRLAAVVGACVHAHAADRAAAVGGERGLLAGDVIEQLRQSVNP